ncbi:hypothetical protein GUO98_004728 [Salmonella enterica]|nr:hypothetical protein [Salmonella enterica]
MTANDTNVSGTGAPSHAAQMWNQTDWPRIEAEVMRLQMRIAKAVREGRWGKVKALQRLLTRSHNGKMLAVKRVTDNRGHSFAVHNLRKWFATGKDVGAMLPILQTYMGHYSIADTAYYLRLTAESYPHIVMRLDETVGHVVPSLKGGLHHGN